MRILQQWKFFLMSLALLPAPATAETINWYNTPKKVNHTSGGQNMDASFQFQLGVFTGGFVPTVANMTQWASHWVSAQSTSYNPAAGAKSFDSNFTVTGNAAPFTVGAKGYVWGRSTAATKDEWILFRKSDWTWPAPNPMSPEPLYWNAAAANEIILGSINSGGTPFLMKSAAVSSYSQWQAGNLAGEPLSAANDDPDHDGSNNLLEFALGTPPLAPGAPVATPVDLVEVSGQKYLRISIPRGTNRLADLTVQVSGNLIQWNSGTSYTLVIEDSATALVVRDLTPYNPASPQRFMRLKAALP